MTEDPADLSAEALAKAEAPAPERLLASNGEPPASPPSGALAKAEALAAIIRNGLSNGPIAQSAATWDHLNTRLGEIVAALMKEI